MDLPLIAIIAVVTPFISAVISPLIAIKGRKRSTICAKLVCVFASFGTLFLISWLLISIGQEPIRKQLVTLSSPVGTILLGLYIDRLSLLPAFISSLFTALAMVYNLEYLSPRNKSYDLDWSFNRSYPFILLFNGSMLGTLFSDNLFTLVIFWEMISLCSYALISFRSEDQACLKAASKCLIMTQIGSIALLIATVPIYYTAGTLEISQIGLKIPLDAPVIPGILILLIIAFLPKTVLFPFHTWLPDGTVAPTSATVLFHVCGFQSGIYLIIRFFYDVFHTHIISSPKMPISFIFGDINIWGFILSVIGAITLILGALNGLIENDFKRIVAYSTISQLGYIVMTIGLCTPLGITAGLFHMISHALYCGLLFLAAGSVIFATGKHNINELGDYSWYMPITTACSLIGILSLASTPLLSDFASKYLIFTALIEAGSILFLFVAVFGCILNIAIALRLFNSVFLIKPTSKIDAPIKKDPPVLMVAPMVIVSVLLPLFGILPVIPLVYLVIPAVNQMNMQIEIFTGLGVIKTVVGFWDPPTIALLLLSFSFGFLLLLMVSRQHTKPFEKRDCGAKKQPFLCGEDIPVSDIPRISHFYYPLMKVLKIDRICAFLNVDRVYNPLLEKFSKLCKRLQRGDIIQNYPAAVFGLMAGTLIIFITMLLG